MIIMEFTHCLVFRFFLLYSLHSCWFCIFLSPTHIYSFSDFHIYQGIPNTVLLHCLLLSLCVYNFNNTRCVKDKMSIHVTKSHTLFCPSQYYLYSAILKHSVQKLYNNLMVTKVCFFKFLISTVTYDDTQNLLLPLRKQNLIYKHFCERRYILLHSQQCR